MRNKRYYSTSEAGEILGISRISVFRRIKRGDLPAERVGRAFMIPAEALGVEKPSDLEKQQIEDAVHRVVKEYGWVLKKLGEE